MLLLCFFLATLNHQITSAYQSKSSRSVLNTKDGVLSKAFLSSARGLGIKPHNQPESESTEWVRKAFKYKQKT